MLTRRGVLAASGAVAGSIVLPSAAARAQASGPYAVADFFKPGATRSAALSPDGGRIAILKSEGSKEAKTLKTAIITLDAADPSKILGRALLGPTDAVHLEWASEERLLVHCEFPWEKDTKVTGSRMGGVTLKGTVRRVASMTVDGSTNVTLFNDPLMQRANFDLTSIVDTLRDDPDHVLMSAWDPSRGVRTLYRVSVITGAAELFERGDLDTYDWVTVNGVPILRFDINPRRTLQKVYARAPDGKDWAFVGTNEIGALPTFEYVAPTEDPNVILAVVRMKGEDRQTIRKMDLRTQERGELVASRPNQDIVGGLVDSRGRYLGAQYVDDRIAYDFVDPALGKHFAGINAFFGRECNVDLFNVDAAQNRFLAYVSGPREPGAFYFYDKAAKRLENLGQTQPSLQMERLAPTTPLKVTTRDGATVVAYLTQPVSGAPGPLVVLPHGGPEARDTLAWNRQVQVLAAQGWWVLQPNFRGSSGYGRAFVEAGHRRWADRMQEDIEDAVAQVVAEKKLDAGKVAIMGASYGGYAALMGAVRRPELYKAAISICGVTDPADFLEYRRLDDETPDKEIYKLWVERIGDPVADAALIAAASPRQRVGEIRCPVLLVHGKEDYIVPVRQSRIMHDALKRAGKSVELVEIPDAGHGDWEDKVEQDLLTRYVALLNKAFQA